MRERPALTVAVTIDRHRAPTRWEDWRFSIVDVTIDEGQFGDQPRLLHDDGTVARFLHPGLPVELHTDEGEGYYLNLTSGQPSWFVWWRIDDDDPSMAWPQMVTLSYHEAGRQLDAEERVDTVVLPSDVREELQAFTDAHYRPEPKRRVRPASFKAPDQR